MEFGFRIWNPKVTGRTRDCVTGFSTVRNQDVHYDILSKWEISGNNTTDG
jgi:hypothetical protein